MTIHSSIVFSIAAATLAACSYVRYTYTIWHGKTKPRTASWLVWAVVSAIIAVSFFLQGGGVATLAPLLYAIGPLLVLACTYAYSQPGWSRQDTIALGVSLFSLLLWWHFHSARIALFINIATDSYAFIDTLQAVRKKPLGEDWVSWLLSASSGLCTFFAVNQDLWTRSSFEIPAYPLVVALLNGVVAYYALQGRLREKPILP